MKNPFRRRNEVDAQLSKLREIAAEMQDAADRMALETSAPRLKQKLAELDPRLLDLLIDQSRYETIVGSAPTLGNDRTGAVKTSRYFFEWDVQISNAWQTWTDWGFGRSLQIVAVDKKADDVWQECWKAPRNRALFGQQVIHELSRDVLRDGEVFFVGYASRQDGAVTWRSFDSLSIIDIVHPQNDDSVNVWYIVQLGDKQVAIPDAFTYFALKDRYENTAIPKNIENINGTENALNNGGTFTVIVPAQRHRDEHGRGWPEFSKAFSWSQVYAQMLREYSAVFSAVAMYVDKLKIQGGSRTVTDVITALQSSLAASSGDYTDTNPRAAAGSTWAENEAIERTRLPLGSAAGDAQTGTLTVGTQLATALGVKLSDIGRPDAFQNKATADIAAESPQQRWQRYQLFWSAVWSDIVETTLRLKSEFTNEQLDDYAADVSTNLPLDIETETITKAMDATTRAATGGALDFALAARANAAFLELMMVDLGIENVTAIIEPQESATPPLLVNVAESHAPIKVAHICPLCGHGEANSYDGHGTLLVCAGCGKTYDPEVE